MMRIEDRAVLSTLLECLQALKIQPDMAAPVLACDLDAPVVITGIHEKIYNSIFLQNPSNDAQCLQEAEALQQALNIPLTLWVADNTPATPRLHQMLGAKYASPGPFYGMLLDLDGARVSPCPQNIRIEPVSSPREAEIFAEVFSNTFGFPDMFDTMARWAMRQNDALNQDGISYIARVDGAVAGICSLIVDRAFTTFKTGGFYNACVLPEFRNRGVGTAMACHRVNVAKALGLKCVSIVLMSDAMARGYCERLGFVNCGSLTPYFIQGVSESLV